MGRNLAIGAVVVGAIALEGIFNPAHGQDSSEDKGGAANAGDKSEGGGGLGLAGGLALGGLAAGGLAMGGGKLLGTLFKGAKMLNPLGLGMMAGGVASTMVADRMAAGGTEMPEPGGVASGVSMFTGFDPRLLQMGIDYLGTVPALLGEAWTAITGVVGGWAEAFGGYMNDVVAGATGIWNNFINFFTVTLPGYFTSGAEILGGIMGTVGEVLGAAVQGVVDGVMFVFDGLVQYYTVTLPGMFEQGVEVIVGIFNGLAGFFVETLPAAFAALGGYMLELADTLMAHADAAVAGVMDVFGGLVTFVTETIPAEFNEFLGAAQGWGNALIGLAGRVASEFVENLGGIADFFIETLPRLLQNGAAGVINALINGLVAAARALPGVGNMIADQLADYLQGHSPPKEGPLSWIVQGGRNVMMAWTEGVASAGSAVKSVGSGIAGLLSGILGRRTPAVPAITAAPGAVAGGVAGAVASTADGVKPAAPAQPAEPGMFGQAMNMVTEKFTGLMGSLSPLAMVATVLEGVFKGLQPAIDALKEPLRIVGEILGAALAPILEALFPVFKMIAIAATWVGQIFFTIAGAILTTVGALVKGLGKLISKLPGVGDFGLVKVGDGLINMGKGFKDSAKALAEGREKIKALEFGKTAEATQQTAEAATQANEALRNLPSGFKIALARYQVTTGEPVGLARATLPTGASTGAVAQDNRVTVQGNIVIQGADKDGRQLWEEMQREMQRQSLRQNGTTLGYAVAI
jgi:phage-related protein